MLWGRGQGNAAPFRMALIQTLSGHLLRPLATVCVLELNFELLSDFLWKKA